MGIRKIPQKSKVTNFVGLVLRAPEELEARPGHFEKLLIYILLLGSLKNLMCVTVCVLRPPSSIRTQIW